MIRLLLLITTSLLINSCATLSKEDCQKGDWETVGLKDGRKGLPETRIDSHNKACAEFKVTIDRSKYLKGRTQGLKAYCNLDNAFREGEAGHTYHNVCSDKKFYQNYRLGKKIYTLKSEITTINRKIAELESSLDSEITNHEDQRRISRQIRKKESEKSRLEKKIIMLKVYIGKNPVDFIDLL